MGINEASDNTVLELDKRIHKLDKGVVIYFNKRHPIFDYAKSFKTDVYPTIGKDTIVLHFVDKTPDAEYATIELHDEDSVDGYDFVATLDTANILAAFGADELTDELIAKGTMRLKHVVLLSYTNLLDYSVPKNEVIY